jgi:hypothetical protein
MLLEAWSEQRASREVCTVSKIGMPASAMPQSHHLPLPTAHPPPHHPRLLPPLLQPLSLEELLKQRQQAAEAQAKPVFMTKDQRAKLAMQKRQEEADAARGRLAEMRQGLAEAGLAPAAANGGSRGGGGAGPSGRDDRDRCAGAAFGKTSQAWAGTGPKLPPACLAFAAAADQVPSTSFNTFPCMRCPAVPACLRMSVCVQGV